MVDALHALDARGVRVQITDVAPSPTHGPQRELIFSGVSAPESQWKAEVAAGVFAARGFSLTWINDGSGMMRYNRVTGRFAVASRRQVVGAIERAAQTADVRLDSVELLHPLTYAPVVTITVPDRARFEKQGGLHVQALLNYARPRVEGIFLIARDSHGRIWSRGGTAIRLGTGAGNWPGSTHGYTQRGSGASHAPVFGNVA